MVSPLNEGSACAPTTKARETLGSSPWFGISIKLPHCVIFPSFPLPCLQPQPPSSQPVREEELMLTFFPSLVVPQMINRESGTHALPT